VRSQRSIRIYAQALVFRRRLQKSSQDIVNSVLVQRAMLSTVDRHTDLRFRKLLRTCVNRGGAFFLAGKS
jgi:hypothetical protein